jgi:hypothetical protein
MPPVSVTMQPRNLPADVPEPLEDGEVAEPHADSTTSATAAVAAVINFFNNYLLIIDGQRNLAPMPPARLAPAGRGTIDSPPPSGLPEG